MDRKGPVTGLSLIKKRLRGYFMRYLVITLVRVRLGVIFVAYYHHIVTPKKEENMNKVG